MTNSELFDQNGFLPVHGMIVDSENLYDPPPLLPNGKRMTGFMKYHRKDVWTMEGIEKQVAGSLARYNVPIYKQLHFLVKKEVEKLLGIDLLPTYYYDRFYYMGQELTRHTDRESCEYSVTLQISSNREDPWPIWFQLPDGREASVSLKDGDAIIYKGCERLHWREPLQSKYGKWKNRWRRLGKKEDDTYHHQVFFHYVNAQGPFVHYANDNGGS